MSRESEALAAELKMRREAKDAHWREKEFGTEEARKKEIARIKQVISETTDKTRVAEYTKVLRELENAARDCDLTKDVMGIPTTPGPIKQSDIAGLEARIREWEKAGKSGEVAKGKKLLEEWKSKAKDSLSANSAVPAGGKKAKDAGESDSWKEGFKAGYRGQSPNPPQDKYSKADYNKGYEDGTKAILRKESKSLTF